MEGRGHEMIKNSPWQHGKLMAIRFHKDTGLIEGAVSAKGNIGYALGW